MATGNISQRRDDDDGHLFHDVDDNPMDTVIAPNVQHVTGAAIITVVHKTDSRDKRQATPSSDDENVQEVHKTPARAAGKATTSTEKSLRLTNLLRNQLRYLCLWLPKRVSEPYLLQ
ncbi:hypothetical protein QL285_059094 [Trifolium repens]|nr:hypothetical protein QL285_059094 [Trifolium repens]